jgi:alkylation response protein AidB-like acyl-CoA dehydrogenase
MYLALDTNEQEIANAAATFLGKEFPLERLHGDHGDSQRLAEFSNLGWLGLSAPDKVGGSGLSIIEEMLFFLEMGRIAGPVGVLAQILAVAAAQADPDTCGRLINGEADVALVVEQASDGKIRLVGDDNASYALAVSPRSATLFELDISACREVVCLDRSVKMFVGDESALKPVVQREGGDVWLKAQIDVSAMMIGIAERALNMIVEYAKERQTFGRPIGAYQAVRHPCSDMAVRVEVARCQLFYAATALKEGQADAAMQVDAARLVAERAARANTDSNIQLHGGIGVTDEFSAHLLLKRANLLWRLFGSSKKSMKSLLDLGGELSKERG